MRTFTAAATLLAITLLGACTPQSQAGGNPYPPVPPLVAEVIPKPPVAGEQLVWQPGHWDWSGGEGPVRPRRRSRQLVDAGLVVPDRRRVDLAAGPLDLLKGSRGAVAAGCPGSFGMT
jgi:hypothetical protein